MSDRQFVTFNIGEDLFGLDILLVREINRHFQLTTVDRAPTYVRGVMNLRGQIVTVLDFSVRLGLPLLPIEGKQACIILKTKKDVCSMNQEHLSRHLTDDMVGFLVDKLGDVLSFNDSQLDYVPKDMVSVTSNFMEGVIPLKDRLLITLDVAKLVEA